MFTGTPPATRRNTRGTPGARKEQQEHLPPIRSRLSLSYGAPFIAMPPRRRTAELSRPLSEQLKQTVLEANSRRLHEEKLPIGGSEQQSDSDDLTDQEDFNDSSIMESPTKEMSAEEEERLGRESSMQLEEDAVREMSYDSSPSKHSQVISDNEEDVGQSMEPEPMPEPTPEPKPRRRRTKKDTTVSRTPSRRNPPRRGRPTPSRTTEESTQQYSEDEGEITETRDDTARHSESQSFSQSRNTEWGDEESWAQYPLEKSTKEAPKPKPVSPAKEPSTPITTRLSQFRLSDLRERIAENWRYYNFMLGGGLKWAAIGFGLLLLALSFQLRPVQNAAHAVFVNPANAFMQWRSSFQPSLLPPESADELIKRLMKLEKEIGWIDTKLASHDGQLKTFHQTITELRDDAPITRGMWERVKSLEATVESQQKLLKSGKLTEGEKKHLAKLENELQATNKRIREFEGRLSVLENGYNEIRKNLPDHIALRQDHRGKVTLRPEFLTALLDELRQQGITAQKGGKVTPGVPVSQNWAEWLRTNEHNLKGIISAEADDSIHKAARDGLIVSKETVIRLLKENSEKTMPELERKIAATIAAAEKKLKAKPSPVSAGNNILQHNYEVLASSPDYAAWATGSRIDPYVTSPTYSPLSWGARLYNSIIGLEHPPTTPGNVLVSGGELGNCWAFAGARGNLGIILPLSIFPTDITIEHANFAQAIDKTSAPKDIEFWVEVRNKTLRNKLVGVSHKILKSSVQPADNSIPPAYVKVASLRYDFSEAGTARQVFSVPMQLREVLGDGNGIEKVLFRVNSNYGNDLYTCLYRFRVHGIQDGAGPGHGIRGPDFGMGGQKAFNFERK